MVKALLKKMQRRVLVGDWVAASAVDWAAERGFVSSLLPRSGPPLDDPPVANAQQLVLCFALADPPVEAAQLTRFLVSAEACGLPFLLVFNKADLATPARRRDVAAHLAAWGYEGSSAPRFTSVSTGEGLPELSARLRGVLSVIAGPSGVGKSSLINALRCGAEEGQRDGSGGGGGGGGNATAWRARPGSPPPQPLIGGIDTNLDVSGAGGGSRGPPSAGAADWARGGSSVGGSSDAHPSDADADDATSSPAGPPQPAWAVQSTRAVSSRSGRGRHTTRHVSLLRLPGGGLLADTPGFGLPGLEALTSRHLAACFPEARAALRASPCAFANCSHREEPGCAVRGAPPPGRYEPPEESEMLDDAPSSAGGETSAVRAPASDAAAYSLSDASGLGGGGGADGGAEVGWERYPLYLDLHDELSAREKAATRAGAAKRAAQGTRSKSAAGGGVRTEALLRPAQHRRESRTNANAALGRLRAAAEEDEAEDDEAAGERRRRRRQGHAELEEEQEEMEMEGDMEEEEEEEEDRGRGSRRDTKTRG